MEPAASPGDRVENRYEIIKLIGRGSMADVFEATDLKTKSQIALKILRGKIAKDAVAMERLKREAHVQELIDHRNVAKVHGIGVTNKGEPYLTMELLQGRSLRQVVRVNGAVPCHVAASYMWQAARGLDAAHQQGVFHRDLKPANLMLEPSPGPVERVVVIDFGFAALQGGSRLTMVGHVVGSLAYLAPERIDGDPGSAATDIYALGVIFFELLCGRRPFVAANEAQLIQMQVATPVPSLRELAPAQNIPEKLEAVVLRCLAKKPGERPSSALALSQEIEAAMQPA